MDKMSKQDLQMEKEIIESIEEELILDVLSDMCELRNNLNDDLEMSKYGESGYATYKEVVQAIKKYTLKVLEKKIKKWEKRIFLKIP